MASCNTAEERFEVNQNNPCDNTWTPVFPKWLVNSVTPGILLTGMTIIGYGIGTGRSWAISKFISPTTQLSIMCLLMTADFSSTFFDHSRVSSEPACLTSIIASEKFDEDSMRRVFGAVAVALLGVSAYGAKSGSITLASTGIPFAAMMSYLAWSPQKFQSCTANAAVTGLLASGLDMMTLVGILEVLFASTGNKDTSWHNPTIVFSIIMSIIYVVLVGKYSDYGSRVTPGSCEIDDARDLEEERSKDRRPELYTGILMSVIPMIYFIYLKMSFSEVSCCAIYPTIVFLLFDILTKLQTWKRGDALTGDALHRGIVYILVQILDIMLSSSSMIAVMSEKGLVGKSLGSAKNMGAVKHVAHLALGPLTYVWSIVRLVIAIITGTGEPTGSGSVKRLAEVIKSISLNVGANLVPLGIDSMNASFMLAENPRELNVKCFVE